MGSIFTAITLIIILFESGIALRLSTLRSALRGAMMLAPLSFFLTMTVVACLYTRSYRWLYLRGSSDSPG